MLWPLLGWFGMGVGFMWYWPITLALVSKRRAREGQFDPDGRHAFLSLFFGSTIMGWVGSFYDADEQCRLLDARRRQSRSSARS